MLTFDEKKLREALANASLATRVAFAASTAERLMPAYARFVELSGRGDLLTLRAILDRLWADLDVSPMTPAELKQSIDTCMSLIPREDEGPWIVEQAYAEDAAAALAYALRCRGSGDVQEAVWAARRTYEALDYFVMKTEGVDTNAEGAEDRVLTNPLVQAELARQLRTLTDVVRGGVTPTELRHRAQKEAAVIFGGSDAGTGGSGAGEV